MNADRGRHIDRERECSRHDAGENRALWALTAANRALDTVVKLNGRGTDDSQDILEKPGRLLEDRVSNHRA